MPVATLTELALRNLKPVPGRQVTYIDKSLKGVGVRDTDRGQMSYVLTLGANRRRVRTGAVGILKLAAARTKARTILAEKPYTIQGEPDQRAQLSYGRLWTRGGRRV